MTKVVLAMSVSLDGIAGPEAPDADGMALFESILGWQFPLRTWRAQQGQEGGEDSVDSRFWQANFDRFGPQVIGRRMFDSGYPYWGDSPPFHAPVFVLTHRGQDRIEKGGGTSYTFVTGGIKEAVGQARAVADGKDVLLAGGSASPARGWTPGWPTRSCSMSCPRWPGGACGCSVPPARTCAAPRPSRARARSTCDTRSGDSAQQLFVKHLD